MDLLSVSSVFKKDERGFELRDISFTQQKLQKIAIAGETGSGKTTLLKIIAGMINPDSGMVMFKKERLKRVPEEKLIPGHPGIAYLSQQFDLPHFLRVEQVLEYANELAFEDAHHLYELCHISHLLKRRTDELSGGERQRIALARLLTGLPGLLLLDEPFSNMDMVHKNILKNIISDLREKLKITIIMISHDPLDTLSWADEILVMKDGKIVQKGSPQKIYHSPVNEYVAGLFGKYIIVTPELQGLFAGTVSLNAIMTNKFIRPESFQIHKSGAKGLLATIEEIKFYGSYYEAEILIEKNRLTVKTEETSFRKGDSVVIGLKFSGQK